MNIYLNNVKGKIDWNYPHTLDPVVMDQIWDYTKLYNIRDLMYDTPDEYSIIIIERNNLRSWYNEVHNKEQLLRWNTIKNKKIILFSHGMPFIGSSINADLIIEKSLLVDSLKFVPKNIMYIVQVQPDIERVREFIGEDTWVTAFDKWAEELFRYQIKHSVVGNQSYLKPNPNLSKKPFSLFIRRYEHSRMNVMCELISKNLLEHFYYTFAARWGCDIPGDTIGMLHAHINSGLPDRYSAYKSQILEWAKGVPYQTDTVDTETGEGYRSLFSQSLNDYFNSSYINVVLETDYVSTLDMMSDVNTEKTYKAMFFKKPFIVIGKPKSLEVLRKRGFKTFGHVIDESYDNVLDAWERLDAVITEITRLKNLSTAELENLTDSCNEIIEHNYQLLIDICTHKIPKEYGIANFTKTW